MKRCSKCKEEKTREEFYVQKSGKYQGKLTSWCKSCSAEQAKRYYSENRDRARKSHAEWVSNNPERAKMLKAKSAYGISEEEFFSLSDACEVCGSDDNLCIDHDHRTGVVRGRLCGACNKGLGFFKDDPELLERAMRYLKK